MNTVRKFILDGWLVFASTMVVIVTAFVQVGSESFARRWTHRMARWWARGMLRITGASVRVDGLENVVGTGPYVVMCNHRSHLDTPVLIEHIPFLFGFIVKKELMKIPIFSRGMKSIGCVAISRSNPSDDRHVLDGVSQAIQNGKNILIFPEGSRAVDDSFLPFKKGGVVMAIKSKAPILPVALSGTGKVIPAKVLRIFPGPVYMRIGRPIPTSHLTLDDRDTLLREVQAAIETLYIPGYPETSPP